MQALCFHCNRQFYLLSSGWDGACMELLLPSVFDPAFIFCGCSCGSAGFLLSQLKCTLASSWQLVCNLVCVALCSLVLQRNWKRIQHRLPAQWVYLFFLLGFCVDELSRELITSTSQAKWTTGWLYLTAASILSPNPLQTNCLLLSTDSFNLVKAARVDS